MESDSARPQIELPAALVEELLEKNERIGDELLGAIEDIQKHKEKIRQWMESVNIVRNDSDIEDVDIPTTCGIDGSYVTDHMLSTSIVACAAVAVEGFTPPSETRHWPLKHESFIEVQQHDADLDSIIRGVMKIMETKLAVNAPHDVVLLDGSVTSQVIHMNQAVSKAKDNQSYTISSRLIEQYGSFLEWFKQILESPSERTWASLPKYTSRNEVGRKYDDVNGWPRNQDDRSVLTAILRPGEFTAPVDITTEKDSWHLPIIDGQRHYMLKGLRDDCINAMRRQMVFYYKPHKFTPALRIETGDWIKTDSTRLARLLRSIKFQFASYAIMEPYPLYMADRMVKNLGGVVPTLKQAALQKISEQTSADTEEILFSTRGYRTEGGR